MGHLGKMERHKGVRQILIAIMYVLAMADLSVANTSAKPQQEKLTFGGKHRIYYVFIPSGLATPAPLILLLHGSGRSGMSLIDPWKKLAQKEGIILVAPDSNDDDHWDERVDGPDFLRAVLTEVESKDAVDPTRIYLFGHSAGAIYALYLSIVESEYFAATAVHAGVLLNRNFKLIASAKRKIPISIWVGTADERFPLSEVRATRDALKSYGFPVELHEIPLHDHTYYVIADEVNGAAWQFLRTKQLEKAPIFFSF